MELVKEYIVKSKPEEKAYTLVGRRMDPRGVEQIVGYFPELTGEIALAVTSFSSSRQSQPIYSASGSVRVYQVEAPSVYEITGELYGTGQLYEIPPKTKLVLKSGDHESIFLVHAVGFDYMHEEDERGVKRIRVSIDASKFS